MSAHHKFLSLAVAEAFQGIRKKEGGPFGTIIVKNKRILARAHNTVLKENNPTCHAEINAIRKAVRRKKSPFLKSCVVYSTTEPCPMCFSALHWAQVKTIVFSTSIKDVKKLGFNELTIPIEKLKSIGRSSVNLLRIKHQDCYYLLHQWKKLPGQKTY